jgi:hypothetical protein
VSFPGDRDFEDDLLSAKERDLKPLLEESVEALDLGYHELPEMERFLDEAWFSGTRSGHAQMRARAIARRHDVGPVRIDEIEAEFRALMEASADVLDLTMNQTICMWNLLGRAWAAGSRTCEAELTALFIELRSDVAEEALQWLETEGEEEEGEGEEDEEQEKDEPDSSP